MLDQGPEGAEREKQVVEGSYCEGLSKRRNPYEAFVSRAQKEYQRSLGDDLGLSLVEIIWKLGGMLSPIHCDLLLSPQSKGS